MLPIEARNNPGLKPYLLSIHAPAFLDIPPERQIEYQSFLAEIGESLKILKKQHPYLARFCHYIITYTNELSSGFTYFQADWLLNRTLPFLIEPLGLDNEQQEAFLKISTYSNQLIRLRPLDLNDEKSEKLSRKFPIDPFISSEGQLMLDFIKNIREDKFNLDQFLNDMRRTPQKKRKSAELNSLKTEIYQLLNFIPQPLQNFKSLVNLFPQEVQCFILLL